MKFQTFVPIGDEIKLLNQYCYSIVVLPSFTTFCYCHFLLTCFDVILKVLENILAFLLVFSLYENAKQLLFLSFRL